MKHDASAIAPPKVKKEYLVISKISLHDFTEQLNCKVSQGWDVDGNINVTRCSDNNVIYTQLLWREIK